MKSDKNFIYLAMLKEIFMKIFDAHIHARNKEQVPEELLSQMAQAGVSGGCIFSSRPVEYNAKTGIPFEDRINEALGWTKGYEDRLFPVLWIHPYEENIFEKIDIAVNKGIAAFKIICGDFYINEDQCIKVLTKIAGTGKPVFFHSGILWDGTVSSIYNRPIYFESLLRIKGLRFSMGHCSWPWIDECIALYGEFLNSLLSGETAEMFFDITPGTPKIYREELLTKLYTIGYDVSNNIFFGTDSNSTGYNDKWVTDWLETDNEILDKLGVSKENKEKLYHKNLMRFLGKDNEKIQHISPETDDSHTWSPVNPKVSETIEKWYKTLEFPKEFDSEFNDALKNIKISDSIEIEKYKVTNNGKRDLLSFLFMCENLKEKYEEKKIPQGILIDTLKDIVVWNNIWSDIKGELYLGECNWLKNHLSMKLFKLGRLQFCMGKALCHIPEKDIKKGDNVIEVHIPETGPLLKSECEKSVEMAKAFFKKYFPEFEYKCFTCHSWLLDDSLKDLLNANSNILDFQSMFELVEKEESDAILKYVFNWNTTRRKLKKEYAVSSLAQKVKNEALKGRKFYEAIGFIK